MRPILQITAYGIRIHRNHYELKKENTKNTTQHIPGLRAVVPVEIVIYVREPVHVRVEQVHQLSVGAGIGGNLPVEVELWGHDLVQDAVREYVASSVAHALLMRTCPKQMIQRRTSGARSGKERCVH